MRQILTFLWAQADSPEVRFFTLKDPNPEPNIAWFILNAFFFIAVALAVTFVIAVVFGGFRFWLLENYPNNKLNGEDEDDLAKTFRLND